MSQAAIGNIDPQATSGSQLAQILTNFGVADLTMQSGATRPSFAQRGTLWLDTSGGTPVIKICGDAVNGSQDIPLVALSAGAEGSTVRYNANNVLVPVTMEAFLAALGVMVGATSGTPGVKGLVPPAAAGEENYVLLGSGLYAPQSGARQPLSIASENTSLNATHLARLVRVSAATLTIKLPAGTGLVNGDFIDFETTFAQGSVTIQRADATSDEIDGASSRLFYGGRAMRVIWDGSAWFSTQERKLAGMNIITSTGSLTITAEHLDKTIAVDSGSAQTITVPTNATMPAPNGTTVGIIRDGAGDVEIVPVSGTVSIVSDGNKRKLRAQTTAAQLIKRNTNVWQLVGSLKA